MNNYTYFAQQGNTYSLKPQTGLGIGLVVIFVSIGISIIDVDRKVFMVKNNAFQSEVTYPFDSFDGITLHRVKYFGILTINVSAVAYFIVDGKEKAGSLNTAFTTAPIQRLINEIDDILEQHRGAITGQRDNSIPTV